MVGATSPVHARTATTDRSGASTITAIVSATCPMVTAPWSWAATVITITAVLGIARVAAITRAAQALRATRAPAAITLTTGAVTIIRGQANRTTTTGNRAVILSVSKRTMTAPAATPAMFPVTQKVTAVMRVGAAMKAAGIPALQPTPSHTLGTIAASRASPPGTNQCCMHSAAAGPLLHPAAQNRTAPAKERTPGRTPIHPATGKTTRPGPQATGSPTSSQALRCPAIPAPWQGPGWSARRVPGGYCG